MLCFARIARICGTQSLAEQCAQARTSFTPWSQGSSVHRQLARHQFGLSLADIRGVGKTIRLVFMVDTVGRSNSSVLFERGIVHCTLLGRDFVIINDEKIVHELLEQRSAIYADRPSLSFVDK